MLLLAAMLGSVFGCAARPCLPERARVASRQDGVPETIWHESAALIERGEPRYCQVLAEPAFAAHHAVWLTMPASGDPWVHVAVLTDAAPSSFEAPLDHRTAEMLELKCRSFLATAPPACPRTGADGVWYHAGHFVGARGYAMRSFWSPRHGTADDKLVRVAEALRDYAVAPEPLRSVYWIDIQDAASNLGCALDPEQPPCSGR
jgi:hypothetical protein